MTKSATKEKYQDKILPQPVNLPELCPGIRAPVFSVHLPNGIGLRLMRNGCMPAVMGLMPSVQWLDVIVSTFRGRRVPLAPVTSVEILCPDSSMLL